MLVVPIGQVVGVAVGVVDEAAFLGDQPGGVGAGAALVPAQRPLAGQGLVDLDGLGDVLAFQRFGEMLVVDPAIAVAGDLPAGLQHGLDGVGLRAMAWATP